MEEFKYYLMILTALVVGIFLIRKGVHCLFRIIITVVFLAVLAYSLYKLGYITL